MDHLNHGNYIQNGLNPSFPKALNPMTTDDWVVAPSNKANLKVGVIDHLPTSCFNDSRKRVSIALLQVLSISHLPTSCFGAICSIADSRERRLFTEFDFGLDRSASIGPFATPSSDSHRIELIHAHRSSLSSL
uniref:Uncharacterized protein n=1 Tax=Lactuca sativa TaxID=4236 RepID=A0A9R1WV31_LACSA|nr:hypothetical protein LSAT_V11C800440970 [Lactuca sativa]